MSDYISREELKLRIHKKIEDIHKEPDGTLEYADALFANGMYRALDLIEHIPSADVRENRWIPVSERLPEEDTKVYLVCCADGYIATIMYSSGRWLIEGGDIIAWMPLPEPYKEEREDEK